MNIGRFAQVYVEIDLNTPLVGKININNFWYNVEYEDSIFCVPLTNAMHT
uniref:Uncharacterized protein n=1 Tax=Cajanus cajan TaxID=3821 RepID=A0A151SMK6_CAJCA|nr:hypothetical protein KK1_002294 [Cajanus cajan]